jgi:hypothetical protein
MLGDEVFPYAASGLVFLKEFVAPPNANVIRLKSWGDISGTVIKSIYSLSTFSISKNFTAIQLRRSLQNTNGMEMVNKKQTRLVRLPAEGDFPPLPVAIARAIWGSDAVNIHIAVEWGQDMAERTGEEMQDEAEKRMRVIWAQRMSDIVQKIPGVREGEYHAKMSMASRLVVMPDLFRGQQILAIFNQVAIYINDREQWDRIPSLLFPLPDDPPLGKNAQIYGCLISNEMWTDLLASVDIAMARAIRRGLEIELKTSVWLPRAEKSTLWNTKKGGGGNHVSRWRYGPGRYDDVAPRILWNPDLPPPPQGAEPTITEDHLLRAEALKAELLEEPEDKISPDWLQSMCRMMYSGVQTQWPRVPGGLTLQGRDEEDSVRGVWLQIFTFIITYANLDLSMDISLVVPPRRGGVASGPSREDDDEDEASFIFEPPTRGLRAGGNSPPEFVGQGRSYNALVPITDEDSDEGDDDGNSPIGRRQRSRARNRAMGRNSPHPLPHLADSAPNVQRHTHQQPSGPGESNDENLHPPHAGGNLPHTIPRPLNRFTHSPPGPQYEMDQDNDCCNTHRTAVAALCRVSRHQSMGEISSHRRPPHNRDATESGTPGCNPPCARPCPRSIPLRGQQTRINNVTATLENGGGVQRGHPDGLTHGSEDSFYAQDTTPAPPPPPTQQVGVDDDDDISQWGNPDAESTRLDTNTNGACMVSVSGSTPQSQILNPAHHRLYEGKEGTPGHDHQYTFEPQEEEEESLLLEFPQVAVVHQIEEEGSWEHVQAPTIVHRADEEEESSSEDVQMTVMHRQEEEEESSLDNTKRGPAVKEEEEESPSPQLTPTHMTRQKSGGTYMWEERKFASAPVAPGRRYRSLSIFPPPDHLVASSDPTQGEFVDQAQRPPQFKGSYSHLTRKLSIRESMPARRRERSRSIFPNPRSFSWREVIMEHEEPGGSQGYEAHPQEPDGLMAGTVLSAPGRYTARDDSWSMVPANPQQSLQQDIQRKRTRENDIPHLDLRRVLKKSRK